MMANFEAFAEGSGLNAFGRWFSTIMAEKPIGGYDNNNLGFSEGDQAIMQPVSNGELTMSVVGALASIASQLRVLAGGMTATGSPLKFNGDYVKKTDGAYAVTKGVNACSGRWNCISASFAGAKRLLGLDADAVAAQSYHVGDVRDIPGIAKQIFGRAETFTFDSMKSVVKAARARGPGSVGIVTELPNGTAAIQAGHTTVVANEAGIIRFYCFQAERAAAYVNPSLANRLGEVGVKLVLEYKVTFVTP